MSARQKQLGAILGALLPLLAGGTVWSARALARQEVAVRVEPLERDYLAHKAAQEELPAVLKQMNKKLDALCRVHPGAACPLGEKE